MEREGSEETSENQIVSQCLSNFICSGPQESWWGRFQASRLGVGGP